VPASQSFIGIYHHPAVGIPGVHSREVKDTWTTEAVAFASSYIARSGLWLRFLVP
jgi:hypothetical protein